MAKKNVFTRSQKESAQLDVKRTENEIKRVEMRLLNATSLNLSFQEVRSLKAELDDLRKTLKTRAAKLAAL